MLLRACFLHNQKNLNVRVDFCCSFRLPVLNIRSPPCSRYFYIATFWLFFFFIPCVSEPNRQPIFLAVWALASFFSFFACKHAARWTRGRTKRTDTGNDVMWCFVVLSLYPPRSFVYTSLRFLLLLILIVIFQRLHTRDSLTY